MVPLLGNWLINSVRLPSNRSRMQLIGRSHSRHWFKSTITFLISRREHDASKGARAHDKLGGEACGTEHLPSREKETIAKCIAGLKLLAKKAPSQPVL
ncbi:hypothetical protein VULLAG_LOCUS5642 [Vulpes lagopus]